MYARSFKIDNNSRIDLCKQLIEQCGYKDKELVSYYVSTKIQGLQYAVHELPIGYLGDDDPNKDLEEISELRKILKICDGTDKDFSNVFSDIEKEIKGYIKTRKKK